MSEVICKMSVFVEDLGVILWTGKDEAAIISNATRKYAGHEVKFGTPRYVER